MKNRNRKWVSIALVLSILYGVGAVFVPSAHARLSGNARQAVVLEAQYALSRSLMNGKSSSCLAPPSSGTSCLDCALHPSLAGCDNPNILKFVGDWNYIGSTELGAWESYDFVTSVIKGCSSNWTDDGGRPSEGQCVTAAYCNTNNEYDFYDASDSPKPYGFYNNIGRGGQCKYFAHLILNRAIGIDDIPSYPEMLKYSDPATMALVEPGDVIFDENIPHTAIVTNVALDKKKITVIETNVFNTNLPSVWGCPALSNEAIGTRTLTSLAGFKIWQGDPSKCSDYNCYYDYYHSEYETSRPLIFVIDDTGSMWTNINYAKAAAIKIMNEEKAKKIANPSLPERLYTLFTFKDGPHKIVYQTYDIDIMTYYLNQLSASGGDGCPESSYTAIRGAAELVPNGDIYMMTDASSNSYGIDDTYASLSELYETKKMLLINNCSLHSIIYSDCGPSFSSFALSVSEGATLDAEQSQCNIRAKATNTLEAASVTSPFDPAGLDGYSMLSFSTGGLFFNSPSSETSTATEMIMRQSTADSTIAFYDGDGANSYSIPVDSSVSSLQFALNVTVGSSVSLEIKNPSGTTVTASTTGVSALNVGGNVFYLIEGAALSAGNWTAVVSGSGTYRISVTGSTTNPMTYTGMTSAPLGGELSMSARFRAAITGKHFEIVTLDGTHVLDVTLASADGLIYAGTAVMNTLGAYRFKVRGDGNFQRMYQATISVGSLDVVAPTGKNVLAGTSVSYTFDVKNLGTAEDTYDLFVSSSMGWADTSGISTQITIPAGGVVNINVPVTVPSDAATGDVDNLSVQAISQTNPFIYDMAELQTIVPVDQNNRLPDLVVLSVGFTPAKVIRGSSITVTDTIKNRGKGPAGESATNYYLSKDKIKSKKDTLLADSSSVQALDAAASSPRTTAVIIPTNTKPGKYYVIACADDTKQVTESKEKNNCRASKKTIKVKR